MICVFNELDRKRQINREGEKENRAELFQEYHPAR